jgi:transcriptional regulator
MMRLHRSSPASSRAVEIPVDRIEGKWKASQNQAAPNRVGVLAGPTGLGPASPMVAIVDQSH